MAPGDGNDRELHAVVHAFVRMFRPYVEVVIHDVLTDKIDHIWNSFSDRRPGTPSLIDESLIGSVPELEIIGPYSKIENDGRLITAISVLLKGRKKLLCINFDRIAIDSLADALRDFAAAEVEPSEALFSVNWRDAINETIMEWCKEKSAVRAQLNRAQRLGIVAELEARGLFEARYAAAHVARTLNVSKSTVYSLRQQCREKSVAQ